MFFSTSAGWHLYLNMECRYNWYNTGALARARRARRVGSQQPQAAPRRRLPMAPMVRFEWINGLDICIYFIYRCQWRRCDHQWCHKQWCRRWQWRRDGGQLGTRGGFKQENYFGSDSTPCWELISNLERGLILEREPALAVKSDNWIKVHNKNKLEWR